MMNEHCVATRAEALEIHVAGKLVSAGAEPLQRWRQMSLELDEAANRGRGSLAHGHAHALRPGRNARRLKALDADHDAVAALALFANFHETSNQRARYRMLQDWMPEAQCLQRRRGKSAGHRRQGDHDRKCDRAPTRQICHEHCENSQRHGGPPRWLPVGSEVADDAQAERNGDPGQQSPGRRFGRRPFRYRFRQPAGQAGEPVRYEQPRRAPCGIDARRPGLGAGARPLVLGILPGHAVGAPPRRRPLQPAQP